MKITTARERETAEAVRGFDELVFADQDFEEGNLDRLVTVESKVSHVFDTLEGSAASANE